MKPTRLLCCMLIACALITPGKSFSQGAQSVDGFIYPAGRTIFSLSNSFEKYARRFEGNELRSTSGNYFLNTTALSGSYSMTDDFEATVNIPYVIASGLGQTANNLQDLQFNIDWRMFSKEVKNVGTFSVLASFGVTNPLSKYGYTKEISIGQHSVNMDFVGGLHYQNSNGLFATFTTAFTKRCTPFPNFYSNVLRAGVTTDKMTVTAYMSSQHAMGGENYGDENVEYFMIGQSYTKVGVDGFYALNDKYGVSLGAGYTLDGSNVGRALRICGGFTYRFGGEPEMKRVTDPATSPTPSTTSTTGTDSTPDNK